MPFRFPSRRAVLLFLATMLPRASEAHAILEASEPANGARVPAGAVAIRLRYNSRIDRQRSGLTLTRPDHTKFALPIDGQGPHDTLTATVTLTPGAYVARWQVLSIDGHITRGDVAFTVTGP